MKKYQESSLQNIINKIEDQSAYIEELIAYQYKVVQRNVNSYSKAKKISMSIIESLSYARNNFIALEKELKDENLF
jgi:hypothetical protein